jgi:PAS domain S-box-containing protein
VTDNFQNEDPQRILLALSMAAQNVMRARSSEKIYRVIADEIVALGFQAGIFRLTDDGEYLRIPFLTLDAKLLRSVEKLAGVSVSEYQIPIQVGGLCDQVIREKRTIFIDDISVGLLEALPDGGKPRAGKILKLLNLKQAIYAPLVISGKIDGVLFIMGNSLVNGNIPAVTMFVNLIATALENDRLLEEIRQREIKFRQISENIIDGVVVTIDNRNYWVNPAFAEMFGYSPEEMLGKGLEMVIKPEGLDIIDERARKRAAGDTIPSRVEVPAVHKSGRHMDILVIPRQIKFDDQPATQMIVRDVTVSKQRQEQLKIFSRFVEASNQGFGIGTLDGLVHYANPALLKMMAVTHLEQVVAKPIASFYPPELHSTIRENIIPAVLEQGSWTGEMILQSKGEQIDIEEHYFLIKDEHGLPQYLADVITDIRERKRVRAELENHKVQLEALVDERTQALKERETLFTTVMDVTPDTIAQIDRDGIVLSINQSGAARFGTSPEEMIGVNVYTLLGADLAKSRKCHIDKVFDEGESTHFEDIRAGIYFENAIYPIIDPDSGHVDRVAVYSSDITEQILAQNKIRENEDRLSKIWKAANDGMWDWDLTTNVVYFDPRYYLMAGYRVDEFPHHLDEYQKRVHPDDIDVVIDLAQQHLDGKIDRFQVEFRLKKKDGDWLWILGRGVIVERDADGAPLRFVGTHTDITKRKLSDDRILYQAEILKGVSDAIISADVNFIIQSWNQAAEDIYGWSEAEVLGKPFVEIVRPEYPGSSREQIVRDFANEGEFRGEVIHQRKDGEPFYVLGSVKAIYDPVGEITTIVAVYRDISDRIVAEQALVKSEERYRILAEASPEMIFVIDRNDKVKYVNTFAAEQFGVGVADVIVGMQRSELFPPQISEGQSKGLLHVFETGEKLYAEKKIEFPGREAWLSTWLVPIIDGGVVQSVMGISRDITESKVNEIALAEKLDQLERFNKLTIGREMRVIELKQKVNQLLAELGREPEYSLSYMDA